METNTLPIKLDIGCGSNKKGPEWIGVDLIKFPGVDVELNIAKDVWPWEDNSVDEVHSSHTIEHLGPLENGGHERIHFCNELFRVMKPGASATLIAPHWSSNRAYGDLSHKWPPVAEMWFFYLKKAWRIGDGTPQNPPNAPHLDIDFNPLGYSCNFDATWGYSFRPDILSRNQEYQVWMMTNCKDVIQDVIATLKKPI